jgi:LPS export ABC transporter protein LptC
VNLKQLAGAIVLVLLVYASNQLFRHQESRLATVITGQPAPDAFAENIQLDIMNSGGKRVYQLQARLVEYYPDADRLQLQKPRLEMVRDNGSHWLLHAESGHTGRDGDPIWLTGSVTIQQLDVKSGNPMRIETRDVLVKPGALLAETAQAASITGNGFRIDTNGLRANLGNNTLELHSQVRGRFNGAG